MDPNFNPNQTESGNYTNPQPGQTIGPTSQSSPSTGPASVPAPPAPNFQQLKKGGNKQTRRLMVIIGILLVIFVILAIVVALTSGSKKKTTEQPAQTNQTDTIVKEPTAIELENVNNSISDDISNLSTDDDFPANNLSDENLEL